MKLKSLYIENYKKFQPSITLDFEKEINVLIGINGSGKSSIFEAIALIFSRVKLYCEGNKKFIERDDFHFKITYSFIDNNVVSETSTTQGSNTSIKLIELASTFESGLQYSMSVDGEIVKNKETMLYHLPDNVVFYYAGYSDGLKNIVANIEDKQANELYGIKDDNVVKLQGLLKKQIIYIKEQHYPILFLLNYLKGNKSKLPLSEDDFTVTNLSLTLKRPQTFRSDNYENLYNLTGFLRTYLNEILRLSYSGTVEVDIKTKKPFIPIEFHNTLLDAIHNIGVWPDDYHFNNDGYLLYHIFNLLFEVGILESLNVYIRLNDDDVSFDVKQLSEGEQQIITVSAIKEYLLKGNALLVLDEPDAFLHPQRQRELIPYLHDLLGNNSYNQVVLATHSPNLLNNANSEYVNVIGIDNGKIVKDTLNFYGRSIASVNYNLMGVKERPEVVKKQIEELYKKIELENFEEAKEIYAELVKLLGRDDEDLIQAKVELDFLSGADD
ncbi:ATP-dependent endonuclease [Mesoflavibacter sp.]|uniref:ATP-dependent nuclease n=1 Tax=Mesoflavibacter sp. TaxID=1930902 RepID=UPI003517D747